MPLLKVHRETKDMLEWLAGDDYTMDDLLQIMIEDFIEIEGLPIEA
jgi:hypothetical protein